MMDVTRPTAQAAIDTLVERGDLTETTGRPRGRIYEARAIVETVYGPVHIEPSTVRPELPSDWAQAEGEPEAAAETRASLPIPC